MSDKSVADLTDEQLREVYREADEWCKNYKPKDGYIALQFFEVNEFCKKLSDEIARRGMEP